MAIRAGNSVDHLNPHVVGNLFAQKYYSVVIESPETAHKFYHDESILGRPDCDGALRSISTTPIKKYYLSTDLKGSSMHIDNIDTQTSHDGGLLILVVGSFIMPDTAKCRFTQSFFLAPQKGGGYFVMNDALRYISAEPETPSVKESTEPEHPFKDYVFL
ncbi:hypothetical protein ACQ4PT_022508 [Festuca glaucescens]